MFTVKPLTRKTSVHLTVKPLVRRKLSPTQDRASFIAMLCRNGISYQQAVREFDLKVRKNAKKHQFND